MSLQKCAIEKGCTGVYNVGRIINIGCLFWAPFVQIQIGEMSPALVERVTAPLLQAGRKKASHVRVDPGPILMVKGGGGTVSADGISNYYDIYPPALIESRCYQPPARAWLPRYGSAWRGSRGRDGEDEERLSECVCACVCVCVCGGVWWGVEVV